MEALTCCLTSKGMAVAVEEEEEEGGADGAPLPFAPAVEVVVASFSPSLLSGEGSHLNLTWFLKATAAAWRSSTGASVEMNCGGGERE